MKTSIAGMAAQVFILFISLIILPIYFMSIIQYYMDINRIQTSARNFTDYVIDNRQVSEKALADLNISMAAVSTPVTVKITRETRVINPSTTTPGKPDVTWVYTEWDEDTVWLQGDIVTVEINQETGNLMQQISSIFLSSSYNHITVRLPAMVR